jgi:hypothetical protein
MLSDMTELEIFEDYAVFRPTGRVSLERAIDVVRTAIASARECRIGKLLVDTSGLTGFEPPSIAHRYFFFHDWARAAEREVRLALVVRPELIDPQKFGRTVAANAGFITDVFTTEEEALAWLDVKKPGEPG